MRLRQKNNGFTLIEVLIALAIFSVMSVMAYGGLKTVLNARNGTERAAERLSKLQVAFLLIQQDMQHMAARGIRVGYGGYGGFDGMSETALSAGMGMEYKVAFTRGGNSNPHRPRRSGLFRVGYQLEEDKLVRLVWSALDRTGDDEPQKMVLLRSVSDITFMFDGGPVWPPPGQGIEQEILPKVAEVIVTLDDWGAITRTFAIPR